MYTCRPPFPLKRERRHSIVIYCCTTFGSLFCHLYFVSVENDRYVYMYVLNYVHRHPFAHVYLGNVALNKTGSVPHDSVFYGYPPYTNKASWAVDGVISKTSETHTCTFIQKYPKHDYIWWRVNLQEEYIIYGVAYITCDDKCSK